MASIICSLVIHAQQRCCQTIELSMKPNFSHLAAPFEQHKIASMTMSSWIKAGCCTCECSFSLLCKVLLQKGYHPLGSLALFCSIAFWQKKSFSLSSAMSCPKISINNDLSYCLVLVMWPPYFLGTRCFLS